MSMKARFFSFIVFIFFVQTVIVSVAAAATRIMPLGDSITKGTDDSIPDAEFVGYRETLYLDLIDQGYDIDFVGSRSHGFFADPWHEGWGGFEADQIRDWVYSWLQDKPADIVLLHIGTIDITSGEDAEDIVIEIEDILFEIDQYENDSATEVMVILARIINRQDPDSPQGQETSILNDLIRSLVNSRRISGDAIRSVNMEIALDYPGDMGDEVHPNIDGYNKMADVWFSELVQILPEPDPDPPKKSSGSSDSGCFISTATYGSDMEPHIKAPVDFLDHFLLSHFVGRALLDVFIK